ncbi:pentapeptide repeat-containing protein [Salinirubellus sp. GCM10025818]|uniref:pentapeptide repeat-containing protein n=1 Tax=Salinirubellus TaxID=2162630 RepID=UPI0030D56DE3
MTDEDAGTSEPATCTFTPDELNAPQGLFDTDPTHVRCSRPVWEGTDSDRCVWHAEHDNKPAMELLATIGDGELIGARAQKTDFTEHSFPWGLDLQDADFTNASLKGADFTDMDLRRADLTNADLRDVTLTKVHLWGATLADADLRRADLTDATLRNADLVRANLGDADLTDSELRDVILTGANLRGAILNNVDLSDADLTGAILRDADLINTSLREVDLTDTDLREADLTGAILRDADLTDADLRGAILTDADLRGAILTDADLRGAILTDADLREADLTDADLRGAILINANLNEAKLPGVTLSRGTQCDDLPGLRETATAADDSATGWDNVARSYHALKMAFAANGLVGRARDYHVLEQDAREREAEATEGRLSQAYLSSKASRYLTGYGVRPIRVGLLMVLLFGIATVVYLLDPGIENSLSYSVVTFTTSPPGGKLPVHPIAQGIALVETFVGTLLIVLLGYVLGNRERF